MSVSLINKTVGTLRYYPDSAEADYQNELLAHGKWRVYDGNRWKFFLNDQKFAIELARQNGGIAVAQAYWDDELQANCYRHKIELNLYGGGYDDETLI